VTDFGRSDSRTLIAFAFAWIAGTISFFGSPGPATVTASTAGSRRSIFTRYNLHRVEIVEASTPAEFEGCRELFREYAASLGFDLSFQDFEAELADPAAFYALLLLAPGRGCVALRDLGGGVCEMKRLYVRSEARADGLGRRLAEAVIDGATRRGYRRMRLDTVPSMAAAQRLYERLGFREIEPYRFNPIPGTRYLELDLGGS
jgi:putative acetyltransferase